MNSTIQHLGNYLLTALVLLVFFDVSGQNLTGMWTGKIYTTDKTLPYEVAISEKDGKLQGFSYTTFTVKGEEMVAMKSIVVRAEKDKIIIEDEDLVFNSFDEESPKQLKQTNTLELEVVNDKTMILVGKFKTQKTNKFRSLTGGIRLRKDSVIEQPKLIAKLEEMDLSKSLSFLEPSVDPTLASVDKRPVIAENPVVATRPVTAPTTVTAVAPVNKPVAKPITKPATTPPKPATQPVATTTTRKPPPPVAVNPKPAAPVKPTPAPPIAAAPPPATRVAAGAFQSNISGRAIETIQTVAFKSDSITLTLYDNGEVDGDTVSVLLNGKTIITKQRLSTNAVTQTIHITPELGDSLQLIMYAENLGSLPPNSGLLIIRDGRDRYEIRFAGDLTKNAAITLRRKRLGVRQRMY